MPDVCKHQTEIVLHWEYPNLGFVERKQEEPGQVLPCAWRSQETSKKISPFFSLFHLPSFLRAGQSAVEPPLSPTPFFLLSTPPEGFP